MKDNAGDTYYFAKTPAERPFDHLSSASLVMDSSGAVITNQRFMPFGEVRTDVGTLLVNYTEAGYTDLGFTGQRSYSYIKLIDYGARWYSQSLGRFIQPDSIIPDLTNSQAWNRFSYVNNNPVKYIDPTGHFYVPPPNPSPGSEAPTSVNLGGTGDAATNIFSGPQVVDASIDICEGIIGAAARGELINNAVISGGNVILYGTHSLRNQAMYKPTTNIIGHTNWVQGGALVGWQEGALGALKSPYTWAGIAVGRYFDHQDYKAGKMEDYYEYEATMILGTGSDLIAAIGGGMIAGSFGGPGGMLAGAAAAMAWSLLYEFGLEESLVESTGEYFRNNTEMKPYVGPLYNSMTGITIDLSENGPPIAQ